MKYSKIIGTGSYLPKKILTNYDLEKMVDTSHQWIMERTGIEQRHVAEGEETTSFMATQAAKNAIEAAGVAMDSIDMIVVATCTPEKLFPSIACKIQGNLEIAACPAFDISAACSGFIYALSMADKYIKAGDVKRALVVGVETMTSVLDWDDRSTCVLFGDGAGAVLLESSAEPGLMSTHLFADGKYSNLIALEDKKCSESNVTKPVVYMEGNKVFKHAVTKLGNLVVDTLAHHSMQDSQIDWLVPHQANIRIIQATAKKLNLPNEKVILTVAKHANTSAASIPLALDAAVREGKIKPGQNLLFESIGAGLTWGAALVKY